MGPCKSYFSTLHHITMDCKKHEKVIIINEYPWRLVHDMDLKTLCQLAAESIMHDMEGEDDEYIIELIKDYYPNFF